MKISFDLDNVLFNIEPIYKQACKETKTKYTRPLFWDIEKCYNEVTVKKLYELFAHDDLYKTPLTNKSLPAIINKLLQNPDYNIYFVTQRVLKQPEKSFQQLYSAGIQCSLEQVIDKDGEKADILKQMQIELHFDDSPRVIEGCLSKNIPVIMISNNKTPYNHYLRKQVKHYKNIVEAIKHTLNNPR